jgi:hypothetical protein
VDDSAGRLFMLEIIMLDFPPRGHGVRFEQGGPGYPEGRLFIDCTQDWGDLKFRLEVQRTTIISNLQHLRHSLPAPLRSDAVLLSAFVLVNLALAMVVYALAFAAEPKLEPQPASVGPVADHLPNGSDATTAAQPRV